MSLTAYEVEIDWVPDPDYINDPPDYEFLAWRLGTNEFSGTALWTIVPVVASPSVTLESLLPVKYNVITLNDDSQKYGYLRQSYPESNLTELEEKLNDHIEYVTDELA